MTQLTIKSDNDLISSMSDRYSVFKSLDGPHKRGQVAEAIIKSELLLRDIPISIPEYDNEPYDFVVQISDSFYRIQAKTAHQNSEGTVRFETLRTVKQATGYRRRGYSDEIDLFAVYNPILDEIYLIPIEETAKGKMEIRYKKPLNNQQVGVNWHSDFLLDQQLEVLRTN